MTIPKNYEFFNLFNICVNASILTLLVILYSWFNNAAVTPRLRHMYALIHPEYSVL